MLKCHEEISFLARREAAVAKVHGCGQTFMSDDFKIHDVTTFLPEIRPTKLGHRL
jgi:hypothetical protein